MLSTRSQDPLVMAIYAAIKNPGPRPDLHYKIWSKHRRQWPTLHQALDRLVAAVDRELDEVDNPIEG
jgi:hypothetical protein